MRNRRMALVAGALALSLAAVAAGCGSSTSNADKTSTAAAGGAASSTRPASAPTTAATAAATKAASTTAAAGGGATKADVTAADFSFTPTDLTGTKGNTITVTFKNTGNAPHTFTVYTDDKFTTKLPGADSGTVSPGGSKDVTINVPTTGGDLYFRCEVHPAKMMGEISIS